MVTQSEAHDGAVRRLRAAIAEQDRLTFFHEETFGTAAEPAADAARREADEQVVAREAWLRWVGDNDGSRD